MEFSSKWFEELDIEEIKGICTVFNKAFLTGSSSGIAFKRSVKDWLKRYSIPNKVKIIYLHDNKHIIATAVITFKEIYLNGRSYTSAFVDDVAVLPQFQRQGLGKKIFEKVVEECRESKVDFAALFAERGGVAWKIYKKYGFITLFNPSMLIKVVNKKRIASAITSYPMKIGLYLLSLIVMKEPPFGEAETVSPEDAQEVYRKLGPNMNLYSHLNEKFFERTLITAKLNNECIATASIREMWSKRNIKIKAGIINNIVFSKTDKLPQLLSFLNKKLREHEVHIIFSASSSPNLTEIFKHIGFLSLKNKISAMFLSLGISLRKLGKAIRSKTIFTPCEHIFGDW